MSITIKYTLVTDGSSDKTLMNIIKWLIDDLYPQVAFEGSFADFRKIKNPPSNGNVDARIKKAVEYFPCDVIFYHRDAETSNNDILTTRKEEILGQISEEYANRVICVVPIKMMENWLLIDKEAIKKGAGNRNYSNNFELPGLRRLESITDPKSFLHNLLKEVSCNKGRRLKNFNVHQAVHIVSENIASFQPLRSLSAFEFFERETKRVLDLIIAQKQLL